MPAELREAVHLGTEANVKTNGGFVKGCTDTRKSRGKEAGVLGGRLCVLFKGRG